MVRLFQCIPNLPWLLYHNCIFTHRRHRLNNIIFLISYRTQRQSTRKLIHISCSRIIPNLTRYHKHWYRIQPSTKNPCNRIRPPRPRCHTYNSHLVIDSCITLCCNCTSLFMMVIRTMQSLLVTQSII